MKVFLSYNWKDSSDIAIMLEQQLKLLGYDVWIDKHHIKAGVKWEEEVEKAILSSDIVIALLSPGAVTRPAGTCLEEISFANYNKKYIIPAMVVKVSPPFGIIRYDFIDFINWESTIKFQKSFQRLIKTLESKENINFDNNQTFTLSDKPLYFDSKLYELRKNFFGRKWLIENIKTAFFIEKQHHIIIYGDAGSGKSAFSAKLIDELPEIMGYHFCMRNNLNTLNPYAFTLSLVNQLSSQILDYKKVLDKINIDETTSLDVFSHFNTLVIEPLNSIAANNQHVVVVIDALDESKSDNYEDIPSLISESLGAFHRNIHFVLTSRRHPEILDLFCNLYTVNITDSLEECYSDILYYLNYNISHRGILKKIQESNIDIEQFNIKFNNICNGNFLCARELLTALETGNIQPNELDKFPKSLTSIFKRQFSKIYSKQFLFDDVAPVLEIVSAAKEPVSLSFISKVLNEPICNISKSLIPISGYFPIKDNIIEPFHISIIDWLTGKTGSSFEFYIDIANGIKNIVEYLYRNVSEEFSKYSDKYLIHHLISINEWEKLKSLSTNKRHLPSLIKYIRLCTIQNLDERTQSFFDFLEMSLLPHLLELELYNIIIEISYALQLSNIYHISESLLKPLLNNSNNIIKARANNIYGKMYLETTKYKSALACFKTTLHLLNEFDKQDKLIVDSILGISQIYHDLGNYNSETEYLTKALSICENSGLIKEKSSIYHQLGSNYSRKGEFRVAIDYYQKTIKLAEESGMIKNVNLAKHEIARINNYLGNYDLAGELFKKISDSLGEGINTREYGYLLYEEGKLLSNKGEFDLALNNLKNGLEIMESINDSRGQILINREIGILYFQNNLFDNAFNYLKKSLTYSEKVNYLRGTYFTLIYLIEICAESNLLKEAKSYLNKLETLNDKLEDTFKLCLFNRCKGVYLFFNNETKSSINYLNKYKELSVQINYKRGLGYSMYHLSRVFNSIKNNEKSKECLEKANSIFNELSDKRGLNLIKS